MATVAVPGVTNPHQLRRLRHFQAVLTNPEAAALLTGAGYPLFGLAGSGGQGLFAAELPDRAAFVVGGETDGVSSAVREAVTGWLSIPMSGPVESLNVAAAASVLCYELTRRDLS